MASRYMDTHALEERYGLPRQYWARLRCKNTGPSWVKISRRKVLYAQEAVEAWLAQHTRDPQQAA